MSTLRDWVNTVDWIEAPSLGADFDGLDVVPGREPEPAWVARRNYPPCRMAHNHAYDAALGWSAGAWLCAIATIERVNVKAITSNLRKSPRFAAMRAIEPGITSSRVWLPFLARTIRGESVYRRVLDGESLATLRKELDI